MSLLFSKQCEYALQATVYIAAKPARSITPIKEVAAALEIPYHFLAKILHVLATKGLLFSVKGPTGGFGLSRHARTITLLKVVEAIDGLAFTEGCVMGFTLCNDAAPCASHHYWKNLRSGIVSMLAQRTLLEVAVEMKHSGSTHSHFFIPINQTKKSEFNVRRLTTRAPGSRQRIRGTHG